MRLVVVEKEVLHTCRLRGGFFRSLAVYFFTYPPPAPGQPLSPWGGVVFSPGQEHCDGHPLMSQP